MKLLSFLLLGFTLNAQAALRTYVSGPDLAMWDDSVVSNGKLFLTIQGTGAPTTGLTVVQEEAAKLGYQVIAVAYPNQVITTVCRTSHDVNCFDNFRKEIMWGIDVSPQVAVTPGSSLMSRIVAHVRSLAANSGTRARFQCFLTENNFITWNRLTVMGHSQGSGHAAYLGKLRPLNAVIMAAGPQDAFADGSIAPWIQLEGQTPRENHFGLLHQNDYFGVHFQRSVQSYLAPRSQIQVFRNRTSDPHNAMVLQEYRSVWRKVFSRLPSVR